MAHLSCVGATREELCGILDGIADAGIENVLALRGDPPRGETEWRPHPGGLQYSTELAALICARYPFCVGAACFPEVHPEAPDMAHDLHFLRAEGRQRRLVPDHPAVLRQRAVLPLRRGGAGGRDRGPDHPRDHADHQRRADQDDHRDVRRDASRRRCSSSSSCAPTTPTRCSSSASPTRRCSAPSCWPAARPGSTSTRSTARRRRARSCPRCGCCALGAARGGRQGWRGMISSAWATVGLPVELVADVDLVVALVGPDPPEPEEPGPRPELLADELALEQQLAAGDPVVGARAPGARR